MRSSRSITHVRQALQHAAQLTADGDLVVGALRDLGRCFSASVAAIYGVGVRARASGQPGHAPPLRVKCFVRIGGRQRGSATRTSRHEEAPSPAPDSPECAAESLFRSTGFDRQLTAPLNQVPYGAPGWMGLVLYRSEVQRPWTLRDGRHLDALVPSMTALVGETLQRRELEHGRDVLSSALETFAAKPTLVFDEAGALVWISNGARETLAERLGRTEHLEEPLRPAVESLLRSRAQHLDVDDLVEGLRVTLSLAPAREAGRSAVLARLAPRAGGEAPPVELAVLSPAERAVGQWLLRGLSNREIGRKLFISENTVRAHLRQIFQKMNVTSRVEAILRLQEHMPPAP